MNETAKETKGAWIIHHGEKLALSLGGAAEFPAIDEAAKSAKLLSRLAESQEVVLDAEVVKKIATAANLNPRHELTGLLQVLQRRRLIDISQTGGEVAVLGITNRSVLKHAADIFEDSNPDKYEAASIALAEEVSKQPSSKRSVVELVGDQLQISRNDTIDLVDRAEVIGFVDSEGIGDDKLLFNGNLFRRNSVQKAARVMESLGSTEFQSVREVSLRLEAHGCLDYEQVERILGTTTLEKLIAAGFYDLNVVGNDSGEHIFVTSPGAFHKFVDPMIDDTFDMAKALVAALTYGMTRRGESTGRIQALNALLSRLIAGLEIGPATAIGQDYRVLEFNRVVKTRPNPRNQSMFFMRLLKREVGELALQVLRTGTAAPDALALLPAAPMKAYKGPEVSRSAARLKQLPPSRRGTRDVLEVLRSGR